MTAAPFAAVPLTAGNHFRVNCYAAVFHLIAYVKAAAVDGMFERHPFLGGYLDEMSVHLPTDLCWKGASGWWAAAVRQWESTGRAHLPLLALDATGVTFAQRLALLVAGLVEEDARFGSVFAELQRPLEPRRPTLDTIAAIVGAGTNPWSIRAALTSHGLLDTRAGGGPRSEETVAVPIELWSALRGTPAPHLVSWADVVEARNLDRLDELIVPPDVRARLDHLAHRLAAEPPRLLVVRGPGSSGRRRILGALARSAGRGALFADAHRMDDAAWTRLGPISAALGVLPVVSYALGPGETVRLPPMPGLVTHAGLVIGTEGGLDGRPMDSAVRLELGRVGPAERRRLWVAHLPGIGAGDLDRVVERFHLPPGHIRRVAERARDAAALAGEQVGADDVARAGRQLNRERLETLAQRLDPPGAETRLVVDETLRERLLALQLRCRHRERLLEHVGPGFGGSAGSGVRVLMTGPSGTGKTLACRLLAAELGLDLYRLDLSAVINKYVGETEKNLHRILSTAEELDVILLIDEGDSLLGARTEVRTANDRFANLETNYLLQRLESYQGIVLVTTNAAESIDQAFQRRMDVVLDLVEPGPAQRQEIWQLHLPAAHTVTPAYLDEVSVRAELTGGQIRNAAMHAALVALHEGIPVGDRHVDRAVATEYGKAGAVSPFLRSRSGPRRPRSEAFLEALS
jgi:hypothetical protein